MITGASQTGGVGGGPPLGNFSHVIPFFSQMASLSPSGNFCILSNFNQGQKDRAMPWSRRLGSRRRKSSLGSCGRRGEKIPVGQINDNYLNFNSIEWSSSADVRYLISVLIRKPVPIYCFSFTKVALGDYCQATFLQGQTLFSMKKSQYLLASQDCIFVSGLYWWSIRENLPPFTQPS